MLPETGVCVCLCTCTFVCAHTPIWASTPEHSANLLHSYANKISYWKKMKLAQSRSFMHFALYVLFLFPFLNTSSYLPSLCALSSLHFSVYFFLVLMVTIQSMEFSRTEYWSKQLFPSPGDLPNPGNELGSPALREDSLPTELSGKPRWLLKQLKMTSERDDFSSVVSDYLQPHELQHARPPCLSPTPGVYSNSCPSSQ